VFPACRDDCLVIASRAKWTPFCDLLQNWNPSNLKRNHDPPGKLPEPVIPVVSQLNADGILAITCFNEYKDKKSQILKLTESGFGGG